MPKKKSAKRRHFAQSDRKPHWSQIKEGKERLSASLEAHFAKKKQEEADKLASTLAKDVPEYANMPQVEEQVAIDITPAHIEEGKRHLDKQLSIAYATGYCQGWLDAYASNKPLLQDALTKAVARGLLENTVR